MATIINCFNEAKNPPFVNYESWETAVGSKKTTTKQIETSLGLLVYNVVNHYRNIERVPKA